MFINFFYLLLVFGLLLFLFSMIIYTLSLFYSSLKGSPYVPSKQKELEYILKEAPLKKGKIFIELGCGDGRVVRTAVKKYRVKGIGIDVNPLIIHYARFLTCRQKISCEFLTQNLLDSDYRKADYIYLFLMPDLLKKLLPFLENQLKKNAVVISHGFKLHDWEQYLFKTISHVPFPTYFYQFSART